VLPLPQRLVLLPQVPAGAQRPLRARQQVSTPPQAYWPFHRAWCRSNDFADALEAKEPEFARWMRHHGKVAVIKDDEVDRIERKARRRRPVPAPCRG